jgi:acyl-coenzyme A thioesterase PaaI-like protein
MSDHAKELEPKIRHIKDQLTLGQQNPLGLRLRFQEDPPGIQAEFTAGPQFQGYVGTVHGGVIAAAFDDAMASLFHLKGYESVTARLQIRYRREAPIKTPLVVSAWLEREHGKVFIAQAALSLPDGTRLAEARGTFVRTRLEPAAPPFALLEALRLGRLDAA